MRGSATGPNRGRERLVELARRKPIPPYSLDEGLTFFCPVENRDALDLPLVRQFDAWTRDEHRPAAGGGPRVLLLLPCERDKPYTLSPEHRAVNRALLDAGFEPGGRGDWPEALAGRAPEELLANGPLRGHGVWVDRAVLSEPFGLVPYEAIYRWRGEASPCARYDDPGLFEHRGIVCSWRQDCTSSDSGRWGPFERRAYVETHNVLVERIAATLDAWRGRYEVILAYVAPGLTHRSFVTSASEKAAQGISRSRLVEGGRLPLVGVNDIEEGMVEVLPDVVRLRDEHPRLPADLLARDWCLSGLLSRISARASERVGA